MKRSSVFRFTLTELLVVITIIAILAAMLLPTLQKAHDRGRTINCASNQKQLGTGMLMYVDSYNGYFPLKSYPDDSTSRWWPRSLIAGKFASASSFLCASGMVRTSLQIGWITTVMNMWKNSADTEATLNYSDGTYPYAYASYGINDFLHPDQDDPTRSQFMARYKRPSSKVLFSDTYNRANWNVNRYVGSSICGFNDSRQGLISPIHDGGKSANITWMDGHVTIRVFPNPMIPYVYLPQSFFNLQ